MSRRAGVGTAPFKGNPSGPTFPPGATHYWPLNEEAGPCADIIGGADLTVSGATLHISGPLDFAAQVNGTGGAGRLVSAPQTSLRATAGWTINLWTKRIGTLDQKDCFSQYNNFTNAGADTQFFMASGSNQSGISLYDGTAATNTNLTIPSAAFDGQWHMLTIRFGDEPTILDLYLDGVFWGSAANARASNATDTAFYVGTFGNSGASDAQGMADIGVWSRALTDAEITQLYNGGTPLRP